MTETTYPGTDWEYISPIQAGFNPEKLNNAKRWLDDNVGKSVQVGHFPVMPKYRNDLEGYRVVIIRGGRIVAEWNRGIERSQPLRLHSASKSVFSSILGIAIAEGKISSADAKLTDYYPEAMDVPEGEGPKDNRYASEKDRAITFRQLISNTSGYMKPGEKPGEVFHYQSYGMNVLVHAIAKTYGYWDIRDPEDSPDLQPLLDKYIANPIGATLPIIKGNFDLPTKARINIFGYFNSISVTALDMARLGWLWRNWGRWQDKQLIPEAWLREAVQTAPDIRANCPKEKWKYGYAFWTNEHGRLYPSLPLDTYAAQGAGRRHILVCPSRDLVLVQSPGILYKSSVENDAGLLSRIFDADTYS